jgi:hypothetical protein
MDNVTLRVFWNVASRDRGGLAHGWAVMTGPKGGVVVSRALCGRPGRAASFLRRAASCEACEARQLDVLHLLSDAGARVG